MTITSTPIPPFEAMRDEFLAMLDAHPDWVNPTNNDDGSGPCSYLLNGRRCAVGEYLHVKGVPDDILHILDGDFTDVGHDVNRYSPALGLNDVHIVWLNQVQGVADGCGADLRDGDHIVTHFGDDGKTVVPRKWGDVATLIRSHERDL